MGGLGTAATTLITTKGLFIDDGITDALAYGSVITPWFRLYIGQIIPPNYQAGSNGGSKPLLPGQIQHLYKVLPQEQQYYVVPRDQEANFFSRNKVFNIELIFNDKTYMKQIEISDQRARTVFKVLNFVNSTKSKIEVAASGLRNVANKAVISVKNLRKRNK